MEKSIIGRHEVVHLHHVSLKEIAAKVDTGAYTSAIHCSSIEKLDNGQVGCIFLDPTHPAYTGEVEVFDIVKQVKVKSSNGFHEERIMIRTQMDVNGNEFDILLTLTNRKGMKFPVLLGRRFLRGKFLVDVSKSI